MKSKIYDAVGCLSMIGSFLMTVVAYVGGAFLHLATTLFAFSQTGPVGGCLTMVTPVLSEIYWVVRISNSKGTVLHPYTFWCLAYVGAILLGFLLHAFGMTTLGKDEG